LPFRAPQHYADVVPLSGWAMSSAIGPSCQQNVSPDNTRRVVERFVDLLYRQQRVREAFEACVAESGYVEHNLEMPTDRETAIRMLEPKLGDTTAPAEIRRVLIDGDLAMVHLRAPGGGMRVEIFRVAIGRIVEHWGVAQGPRGSLA